MIAFIGWLFAVIFFWAAILAMFQWGAQNRETQQLRRLRSKVETVITDHDLPERTLTQNDIAAILKELDESLKPGGH